MSKFESLVQTASNIADREKSIQTTYFLVVPGRYTERAGEILHTTESWLDPETVSISVPPYEDCNCGYCRTQAKRRVDSSEEDRSLDEILGEEYWSPKSSKGARTIPLRTVRGVNIVSRYFQTVGTTNVSYSTLLRRLKVVAELTEGVDASKFGPQVLRATAATYWSWQGLDPSTLKYLFGWKYLHTALYYINRTGAGISQEMERAMETRFQLPERYTEQPPTWGQYRNDPSTKLIEVESWTPSVSSTRTHPRYGDDEEELVDMNILQDWSEEQNLPGLDEDIDNLDDMLV